MLSTATWQKLQSLSDLLPDSQTKVFPVTFLYIVAKSRGLSLRLANL